MVEVRQKSLSSSPNIPTSSSNSPSTSAKSTNELITAPNSIESKSTGCLVTEFKSTRKHGGSHIAFNIEGSESSNNMTGVSASKPTSETTGSASPTVWRKSSHPPLHFNNNETRNRNLQLQLKNRGTKDDWGASLRYDIEETPSIPKLDQLPDIISISSDSTVPTPPISPSVYERFMTLSDNLTALVRCIMEEAKSNTNAESCSLFLIDEEKNELAAKVFDHAADGIAELRVPMGDGVVGRVAKTRTMMNVRDAHKCPFFYANVDELTGFQTRNILCFPIIDNAGALVGVTELCNKIPKEENGSDIDGFTRTDEKYAKQFAIYCANSVSHCLFYKKIQEAQTRCHMATEMYVQGEHIKIKDEDVKRLLNDPMRDWRYFSENFNDFSFAPRMIGENHFHKAAMMFFEDLGFTMKYRMNKRKLSYLVLRISEGYRSVPYHNWSHAFAVAHFCWLMMRTESCRTALDDLERLSMLIACLCHDIDHRGTTNSFQLQSKTPLAQLYSSEGSVLERHHYAQTVSILHMPECDILEQLTAGQYRTVLSNIREVILATDIAAHLKKASRIHDMVDAGYNSMSTDHHYLLTCLIMTASDLSDQSKNFRNAKLIAENIYLEFFAQGDLEAELGVKPLEMMDRDKAYVPQVQLEFLDSIGLPVFEMLAAIIPDGKTTYEAISANRLCWKALHEEMLDSSAHIRHGLTYLTNEEVEQKVFERVRKIDEHAARVAAKRFDPIPNGTIPHSSSPTPMEEDESSHIFDGYHEQYQQNAMSLLFRPNHEIKEDEQHFISIQNSPKTSTVQKATEEAVLLKQIDTGCDGATHRRRARTPRQLWRRARRIMSSVSSTCTSCSPLPSRRHQSKENNDLDSKSNRK